MKTLEEKIKVMSAALAGAIIEYRERGGEWSTVIPSWDWDDFDYRVRPEPEQVPFTFEDALDLIGRKCRDKNHNEVSIITSVHINGVAINSSYVLFKDFIHYYEILSLDYKTWEPCSKTI